MVRIISQNFSPPRSRHSSGETDKDLAERTKAAFASLGAKKIGGLLKSFEHLEYESSSDSFWDSELDGDHSEQRSSAPGSEIGDVNGNQPSEKSDVHSKRKERRRERNKLSAQAYRIRKRHQSAKEHEQLSSLENENKRLHRLVDSLEKKREQAKMFMRGCQVPMPDFLLPGVGDKDILPKKELKPVPEEPAAEEAQAEDSQPAPAVAPVDANQQFAFNPPHVNNNISHHHQPHHTHQHHHYQQEPPSLIVQQQDQKQTFSLPNTHSVHVNANSLLTQTTQESGADTNKNVTQFSLIPTQVMAADAFSKPNNPQILLQTHALVGATVSQGEAQNISACAIPAFVAVAVGNPTQYNANSNINLNFPLPCSVVTQNESPANTSFSKESHEACNSSSNLNSAMESEKLVAMPQIQPSPLGACGSNGNFEMRNGNESFMRPNVNFNFNTDGNGNSNNCSNGNIPMTSSLPNFNLNINPKSEQQAMKTDSFQVRSKPNEILYYVVAPSN